MDISCSVIYTNLTASVACFTNFFAYLTSSNIYLMEWHAGACKQFGNVRGQGVPPLVEEGALHTGLPQICLKTGQKSDYATSGCFS